MVIGILYRGKKGYMIWYFFYCNFLIYVYNYKVLWVYVCCIYIEVNVIYVIFFIGIGL